MNLIGDIVYISYGTLFYKRKSEEIFLINAEWAQSVGEFGIVIETVRNYIGDYISMCLLSDGMLVWIYNHCFIKL